MSPRRQESPWKPWRRTPLLCDAAVCEARMEVALGGRREGGEATYVRPKLLLDQRGMCSGVTQVIVNHFLSNHLYFFFTFNSSDAMSFLCTDARQSDQEAEWRIYRRQIINIFPLSASVTVERTTGSKNNEKRITKRNKEVKTKTKQKKRKPMALSIIFSNSCSDRSRSSGHA